MTIILLTQVSLLIFVNIYLIPNSEKKLRKEEINFNLLSDEKSKLINSKETEKIIKDYEDKADNVKIFIKNRKNMFSFYEDEKFDFFPDFADKIFPSIKKHINNNINIEWISINEWSEIIIPIFSSSYTNLAKQYYAFKNSFKNEKDPILKDIKLNSFSKQEIETTERDNNRNFVKKRKIVSKAIIIWKINPEYFIDWSNDIENYDLSKEFNINSLKKWYFENLNYIFNIIIKNIKKEFI